MVDFTRISASVVLLCDAHGRVLRVLQDPLCVVGEDDLAKPFTRLIDRSAMSQGLSFLADLRKNGAVFGWELPLTVQGAVETLHFAGLIFQEDMLIMASRDHAEVLYACSSLVQSDPELMHALRSAMEESSRLARKRVEEAAGVFDEMSRLNNEMANLQRELARKNAELTRANELKNRFIGIAAHDLRSPLAAIQAYSHFLLEMVDDPDSEQADFLAIIYQSSEFMAHLINDLLDVSTIESGRLELALAPTDLVALVRRNVVRTAYLARRKSITLEFAPAAELPPVTVDPLKIEQVMNNLISNALKYSEAGTCIRIDVTRCNGEAVIAVADEGPGIPAEEMSRLFHYFSRTSARTTGGEDSHGLGLAIARNIVEGHQGRIWAESEQGRGSTFRVALPIAGPVPDPR